MTQEEALAILKTGANVFLTGEPGSGKTHTVDLYIKHLRKYGVEVAVTASTGIAATHLGGMTIHSWSGIGIKKELSSSDLEALRDKSRLISRAQKTSVLIIDEISMLDAKTLTRVNDALCALRYSDKPFGGLQVVFVGDFFQLPPVSREHETVQFAFESSSWKTAKPVVCYLTEQYRHENREFTQILSLMRKSERKESIYRFLTSRRVEAGVKETTTRLYSHNVNVDKVDSERLSSLP